MQNNETLKNLNVNEILLNLQKLLTICLKKRKINDVKIRTNL